MSETRYYLTEPETVIDGTTLPRREREVTREEYERALAAARMPADFTRFETFSRNSRPLVSGRAVR